MGQTRQLELRFEINNTQVQRLSSKGGFDQLDNKQLSENFSQLSLSHQVESLLDVAPLLRQKILQHCDLAGATPEQGLLETLRFLSLIKPQQQITPSTRVDLVWHQFILWTKLYSEYCHTVYGRYLHHTPDDDGAKNQQQFLQCLDLYQSLYGEPDPIFWGPYAKISTNGACSGCES